MSYNTTIGQASQAENVTPSDTVQRSYVYLYVGSDGDVAVAPYGNPDETVIIPAIKGLYIRLHVAQVFATGTTATGIVGFIK